MFDCLADFMVQQSHNGKMRLGKRCSRNYELKTITSALHNNNVVAHTTT